MLYGFVGKCVGHMRRRFCFDFSAGQNFPSHDPLVYNKHEDQAELARYNRYRYIYIRASTKTFNYGI